MGVPRVWPIKRDHRLPLGKWGTHGRWGRPGGGVLSSSLRVSVRVAVSVAATDTTTDTLTDDDKTPPRGRPYAFPTYLEAAHGSSR